MYDRRLDAIIASAELGSFSKAAERLHISTTALVKQVNTFEGEFRLCLFERSRRGVELTPTGKVFVEDARALVRQADDMLARAWGVGHGEGAAVRLGVSILCPGQKVLDTWPRIHEFDPSLKLELVPIGSIYDERLDIVGRLGEDVDLILTSYSPERWDGRCSVLSLGEVPLAIDVPRMSPLAGCEALELTDLAGTRVFILRHTNRATDALRTELDGVPGVEVVDVDDYDLTLFNDVAEGGGALVTSGAWSGLHPMLVTVPLAHPRLAECTLLYPLNPAPAVSRFLDAYRSLL